MDSARETAYKHLPLLLDRHGRGDNVQATTTEFSVKTWWENFMARMQAHYIFIFLCAVGGGLLWFGPPESFRRSLGEATFIAGLLVLFVDPMLKGRLLREASQGIFHYLLGYDQQPEIKDRLQKLVFDTKLFRKNFYMKCIFTPQRDSMRLDLDCSFEIINPTNEPQKYTHCIQCERVERPTVGALTLLSEKETYCVVPELRPKKDDPQALEASAGELEIQPLSKGRTYRFGTKFSMIYPLEFFYAVHVGAPTIGMTIEVVPPEGFEVSVSPCPISTANIWKHDKLFMPGEHVDVRWEKKNPAKDAESSS
jgi:hypothetical protein